MSQLSFSLHFLGDDFSEENFVFLEENSAARNFLEKFFIQESPLQSLILKGSKFSGKSHLMHIFAKKHSAIFLDKTKISALNLVSFFAAKNFYILENFEEIENEELVLRLINSAAEAKAFLVLTTKNNHKFKLKDLVSRLKNIAYAEIKNPNEEAIKQLLVNGFSRRQIKLPTKMIDYIASHIERSYEAVFLAVKKVENFCQEKGKNITVKDLENIFESE